MLLVARVFFYDKSEGEQVDYFMLNIFRRNFSFKYLVPLKIKQADDTAVTKNKKIANLCLYLFYTFFLITIIYVIVSIILLQHPR